MIVAISPEAKGEMYIKCGLNLVLDSKLTTGIVETIFDAADAKVLLKAFATSEGESYCLFETIFDAADAKVLLKAFATSEGESYCL
ncbi:hypothetical protein QE152_g25474 [Popillia japonica]|uniref:Uncharacterized protein n=1 Tax=Popillia japonica TaxID=7064 RepID=A0AAW1K1T1_POPJA